MTKYLARFSLATVLLIGCSSVTRTSEGNGNGDSTPDAGTSVNPGGGSDTCSNQTLSPVRVGAPDILLIQDTSGSMSDGTPSKYSQMVSGLTSVINSLTAAAIEWGLVIFPSDDSCGVGTSPNVAVAMGAGQAVVAAIAAHSPAGNTPLAAAVQLATTYFDGLNDGRAHYLLIATDGEPNCDTGSGLPVTCMSDADCSPGETCQLIPIIGGFCTAPTTGGTAVTAVATAAGKGIKTYVVGIDLGGDSATLDSLATAGGTGPKYYPVTDAASIVTTFQQIAMEVASCTFSLSGTMPTADQTIEVTINGQQVSKDSTHAGGWDVDAASTTITFYGSACMSLQDASAKIVVGYTCPPPK